MKDHCAGARVAAHAAGDSPAAHWPEARTLFERAHALAPSARTLRGLGISAFELRHYVQAVRELEASLVDPRNPLTAEQRSEVNQAVARARRYVGTVSVRVRPERAMLLLDGVEIKERELLLDVGDDRLTARAEGYRDADHALRVAGGSTQSVVLELSGPGIGGWIAVLTVVP